MRILLANDLWTPAIGGVETYISQVSQQLLAAGHSPMVMCSQHETGLPTVECINGISVVRHPSFRLRGIAGIATPFVYLKKLVSWLRTQNLAAPDLILTRHAYYANALSQVFPDTPHLFVQAACWPLLSERAAVNLNLDWARRVSATIQRVQNSWLERRAILRADRVVVLSEARKAEISWYHKLDPQLFTVLPPGVDLQRFSPAKDRLALREEFVVSPSARVILTVCRLSSEKNLPTLLRAMNDLPEDVVLVIAGDGPDRAYLKDLVAHLGISQRVHFLGHRTDIHRVYELADMFVLPSTYEGFGHVFAEAMASGLPCIGMRSCPPDIITATSEIITDGQEGLAVENSPIALANAILHILDDSLLREAMGLAALTRAHTFSWASHTENLLKLGDHRAAAVRGH